MKIRGVATVFCGAHACQMRDPSNLEYLTMVATVIACIAHIASRTIKNNKNKKKQNIRNPQTIIRTAALFKISTALRQTTSIVSSANGKKCSFTITSSVLPNILSNVLPNALKLTICWIGRFLCGFGAVESLEPTHDVAAP